MADLYQLARGLGYVAADLESRGYQYAGGVKQAARVLLDLAGEQPDDRGDRCRRCTEPIVQPVTGRPRIYCSARCRKGRTKPDVSVS